jgi:hypothetical protein
MKKNFAIITSLLIVISSCSSSDKKNDAAVAQPKSKVQEIVDKAIAFHGMEGLGNADFSLTFRERDYTYSSDNSGMYKYTRAFTDSTGAMVKDVMDNNGLVRYTNNQEMELTEEREAAFIRSVNSVIYFFRLPYGLNDPAVIKEYLGETGIKGKTYHEVKITFQQEGGGEDFDDTFLYWFDKADYSMDYFAYLYHTDGGGMRFREATNPQRVNGVLVQDYVNLRPEDEKIDIMTIDELYEAGELKVLSEIINEKVQIKIK